MPKNRIEAQRKTPKKRIENRGNTPKKKIENQDSERKDSQPKAGRPYMQGYGLPAATKGKGLLPWKWAEERLTKSHNYWMATTGPRGGPHVMVVWGVWVGSAFYFSTGRESRKAKNLAANPHCVVCTEKADEAVILEGMAKEITEAATLKKLAGPYNSKYKPWKLDPELGPVYAVLPEVIFGLREKDEMQSATRWRFGDSS